MIIDPSQTDDRCLGDLLPPDKEISLQPFVPLLLVSLPTKVLHSILAESNRRSLLFPIERRSDRQRSN